MYRARRARIRVARERPVPQPFRLLRKRPTLAEPSDDSAATTSGVHGMLMLTGLVCTWVAHPLQLARPVQPLVSHRASTAPAMSEGGGDVQARLAEMQRENSRRGAIELGLVVAIVIWGFSVPPDIRRSVICELTPVNGCVEASAVWKRVVEHYQTCGESGTPCIAWDFSVDPGKRAVVDQLLGEAAEAAKLGD